MLSKTPSGGSSDFFPKLPQSEVSQVPGFLRQFQPVRLKRLVAKERLLSTDNYAGGQCVGTMFTTQLACSFVPCCSALLILSIRARATRD